jgi:TrpR-related protein YerC/YecD
MAEKIESRLTEQLCEAIASLKNEKQIANFLEDACTISEFKSLAQRFEVARLLDEGVKYEDIVARTGASTATISRVKRSLVYGKDGYEAALANLKKKHHETRSPKMLRKVKFEKARAERKKAVREDD